MVPDAAASGDVTAGSPPARYNPPPPSPLLPSLLAPSRLLLPPPRLPSLLPKRRPAESGGPQRKGKRLLAVTRQRLENVGSKIEQLAAAVPLQWLEALGPGRSEAEGRAAIVGVGETMGGISAKGCDDVRNLIASYACYRASLPAPGRKPVPS